MIAFRHQKSAHFTVLFAPSAVFTDYEINSHKDCDQLAPSRTIYFFKHHIFAYLIVASYAIYHHNSSHVNSLKFIDYKESYWFKKKKIYSTSGVLGSQQPKLLT